MNQKGISMNRFIVICTILASLLVSITCCAAGNWVTLPDGLKYIDQAVGDGDTAATNNFISVNYTGWLLNSDGTKGKKFDSSLDRGTPFMFILGAGNVIKGWDEGVVGMKVGGTRTLIVPPQLGYGANGAGNSIPPNATLVFDVTLLKVF